MVVHGRSGRNGYPERGCAAGRKWHVLHTTRDRSMEGHKHARFADIRQLRVMLPEWTNRYEMLAVRGKASHGRRGSHGHS